MHPECVIGFAVDDADEIHALGADGRQRIAVPSRFTPLDGVEVRLLAPPGGMAERYSALVCLPQAQSLPVPSGAPVAFGRGGAALAALRVLEAADCLRGPDGAPIGGADRLGLSRNACSFEMTPEGCRVARDAPTQA
ncbi:hypothetical protein HN295_20150, partial [Acinetobacter baumannii]|uniref:hypothetical protein n=1 Tax=Acinetobacter baumannii TaxID=470 RepID=UPI0018E078F8